MRSYELTMKKILIICTKTILLIDQFSQGTVFRVADALPALPKRLFSNPDATFVVVCIIRLYKRFACCRALNSKSINSLLKYRM